MPGPPPNPPEQRRRRNKPDEFDVLPADGYSGKVPVKLPTKYRAEVHVVNYDEVAGRNVKTTEVVESTFLAATRAWFKTWTTSPQATRFTGTDWNRLLMLAPLVDQFNRTASKDLAAEIRQQEAALGATWGDRQRLRVRIGEAEPGTPAADRKSSASTARRSRLRVVA